MTEAERGPTTEAELRAALAAVLQQARDSGVDVRGGWECGDDETAWDVVVTDLRADRGSGD